MQDLGPRGGVGSQAEKRRAEGCCLANLGLSVKADGCLHTHPSPLQEDTRHESHCARIEELFNSLLGLSSPSHAVPSPRRPKLVYLKWIWGSAMSSYRGVPFSCLFRRN